MNQTQTSICVGLFDLYDMITFQHHDKTEINNLRIKLELGDTCNPMTRMSEWFNEDDG